MGSSFFKGEKKKQKKDKNKGGVSSFTSNAPVFSLPKLIEKKKKSA